MIEINSENWEISKVEDVAECSLYYDDLFHPVPENYCGWDDFEDIFDCPWPEYDTGLFEKDICEDDEIDSS